MLILASKSPRRIELLKQIVPEFIVEPANVDERLLDPTMDKKDLSKEEARLKAYDIFSKHPHDDVLSCDTVVILDGKALGKPDDEDDAFRMLKEESGKKQVVLSSYTFINEEKEISRTVRSYVYFKELSDEQIWDYIKKYQPLDKAGAYGIQDEAGLIDHIEGSYSNIMGLPVEDLKKHVFNR